MERGGIMNLSKYFGVFIFIFISLVIADSVMCNDTVKEYSDSTRPIEVMIGQDFAIVLDSKPEGGYKWQFAKPLDQKMLCLLHADSKSIGSEEAGKDIFVFRTIGRGSTMISLKYAREGERDMYPLESKTFIVIVP